MGGHQRGGIHRYDVGDDGGGMKNLCDSGFSDFHRIPQNVRAQELGCLGYGV